jgi:thiamine-monophosphate kinase
MGGEPLACFLSLGLPARLPQVWVDQFMRGLLRLAREFNVTLAGGDIASAEKITADIVALGSVPLGRALLRSGARAGDRIYVTGRLGASAAVLERLSAGEKVLPSRRLSHFYPVPRLDIARVLRERRLATAAIDLSDGLSVDLGHLCSESHVAAWIESDAIPAARGASLEQALHGGEDYELLFTCAPGKAVPQRMNGVTITAIGEIRARTSNLPVVQIRTAGGKFKPLRPRGWQHFNKNPVEAH